MGSKSSKSYVNKHSKSQVQVLKQLPFQHSKTITMNDQPVIIPMYRYGKEDYNKGAGIYYYDSKQNKWNEIIKYPKDLEMSCRAYSFNKHKNILQLYSNDKSEKIKIFNINLTTKKWDIINTNNLIDDGVSMYTVINDELHIIGKGKHWIWNQYSQQMTQIHSFNDMFISSGFHSIRYLKHKQQLLLFGGFCEDLKQCSDDIYCYSIVTSTWNKLNVKLPQKLHLMGIVATNDEKYVILFGGWGEKDDASLDSKDIYVYNVDKQTMFKSDVCLPTKGQYRAVICENSMECSKLTCGYIREMCRDLIMYIPKEIVTLINKMCVVEYVHFMKAFKHWRVTLDVILCTED